MGDPMTRTPPPTPALGRAVAHEPLAWDGVEPRGEAPPRDTLGLRPDDRAALGMTRTADAAPAHAGDAGQALADLLQRGVAIGKTERVRRR